VQPSGHDIASPEQIHISMAGPKAGRQRMAIAAEGASAHTHVEIVKAAKSPAVLDLLGTTTGISKVFHIMSDMAKCCLDHIDSVCCKLPTRLLHGYNSVTC